MATVGQRGRFLGSLVAFGVVLAAWSLASWSGRMPAFLLPSPNRVASAARDLLADGELIRHVIVSTTRLIVGYLASVVLALPTAFLLSRAPRLRGLAEPILEFLRQVPPLAMMPLLILWLGIGETQKIGIIVLACFFPVFLATLGGIAQCDPKLIEVGRVSGLSEREILRRIVLPAALPAVVIGLRIALGQGWRALVGAELVASAAGLGYMIVDAENLARTDIVLVGILVIGALGLATDWLARRLLTALAPWGETGEAANARL